MRATALAAAALAFAFAPRADAARAVDLHARTAGQLAELCAANPNQGLGEARLNYCHGFAQGAVDVMLHDAGDKKPFCFPNPAPKRSETLGQFVRWVHADPARERMEAAGGLFRFLTAQYPCPK
jgi:hypothetical protein